VNAGAVSTIVRYEREGGREGERDAAMEREREIHRERERRGAGEGERERERARACERARKTGARACKFKCLRDVRQGTASIATISLSFSFLCLFSFVLFFFFVFLTALEHFYFLFAAFHLSLSPPCASLAYIHAQAQEADGLSLFSHLLARRLQACMRDQGEPPGSLVCMYDVICDNIVIMCMYV